MSVVGASYVSMMRWPGHPTAGEDAGASMDGLEARVGHAGRSPGTVGGSIVCVLAHEPSAALCGARRSQPNRAGPPHDR